MANHAPTGDGRPSACVRCGRLCLVAATSNPDARLLKHATAGEGFCANCAMTHFIRHGDGLGLIFREEPDPSVFRARHVQESVERLLVVGNADARADDLDWDTIIAQWALPLPRERKRKRS